MMNWPKVWAACLNELEERIDNSSFLTFIRPLQAAPEDGVSSPNSGVAYTLYAPNSFVAEHVDSKYLSEIYAVVDVHYPGAAEYQILLRVGSASSATPALRTTAGVTTDRRPAYNPVKNSAASDPTIGALMDDHNVFDQFVAGSSNEHAYETALGLVQGIFAKQAGKAGKSKVYNPLALYGGVGVGKTHLMQAVGWELKKAGVNNVAYEHANELSKNIVTGLRNHNVESVLERYATLKVLLLDDVQFLVGREKSQEEVFHLFNKLIARESYVVITCDRYPTDVPGLEDRLSSRFVGGMSVVIEVPDTETKAAILMQAAEAGGRSIDEELAMSVATRTLVTTTARDLKGPIQRLCFLPENAGRPISRADIEEVGRDMMSARRISVETIRQRVADHYNITVQALLSRRRTRTLVRPRQIAMALTRRLTSLSYPEIGERFGGRDHTTAMHACGKVAELEQENMEIREDIKILVRQLSSNGPGRDR